MANKKKGFVFLSGEWKKHLRKAFKKNFWKSHRITEKKMIRRDYNLF